MILPMHLGYGFTAGNAAFEAELGFSTNDFDFNPIDPMDFGGFGEQSSSKLMFNGFYKTTTSVALAARLGSIVPVRLNYC